MITCLRLSQINVSRGGRRVIANLDLDVPRGRAILLQGPNGAGKTTLLRAISGLLTPDSGTIEVAGASPDMPRAELCHWIGHGNGLKSQQTVRDNLSFWSRYLGRDGSGADVERALATFDLEPLADIPVTDLSAGQKRRAGLARLAAAARPIWLLDEPTTSLDTQTTQLVADVIDDHLATGGLAVIATHLAMNITGSETIEITPAAIHDSSPQTFDEGDEVWL